MTCPLSPVPQSDCNHPLCFGSKESTSSCFSFHLSHTMCNDRSESCYFAALSGLGVAERTRVDQKGIGDLALSTRPGCLQCPDDQARWCTLTPARCQLPPGSGFSTWSPPKDCKSVPEMPPEIFQQLFTLYLLSWTLDGSRSYSPSDHMINMSIA